MLTPETIDTLRALNQRAARISAMTHRRAVEAYAAAFNGTAAPNASLSWCVIHNSLIDLERGKPWGEVNYSHMRRAAWLLDQQFEPHRIVTAWYERKLADAHG